MSFVSTLQNDESTLRDVLNASKNENTSAVIFIEADGNQVNTDDGLSIECIPWINTRENLKDALLALSVGI